METRVAVLAVIVQEGSSVQALMHLRMCTAELPQFSRIARRVKAVGRTP